MLDIKFIVDNPDVVKKAARDKNMEVDVDRLLAVYQEVKALTSQADTLRGERNSLSREIPKLNGEAKQEGILRVRDLKDKINEIEGRLAAVKEEFDELMLLVPSVPLPEVPVGKDEADNVELRRVGDVRSFLSPLKTIWVSEALDIVDVPGSRNSRQPFLYPEKFRALLEMAVTRFVIDKLMARDIPC